MSDNVLFDDFAAHALRGKYFEISEACVPGLIIKLGFPDAQFMMAVINPERR